MRGPTIGQHALAVLATLVVSFVLLAVQHGVKDAALLIGFILFFGSMPYTPPPRQ